MSFNLVIPISYTWAYIDQYLFMYFANLQYTRQVINYHTVSVLRLSSRTRFPSASILSKYLSIISIVDELFPIAKRSMVCSWNVLGLMKPYSTFFILSVSFLVSSLLCFPCASHSWKQTNPNSGLLKSLKIPLDSILLAKCRPRSTVYLM